MDLSPLDFALLAPTILIGLVLHELAHAMTADYLGDPTPRSHGRISLNPLRHLDLIGTILLFVVKFGWAKPVLVNPSYFRKPKRDMLIVSLAGPATNLALAALYGIGLRIVGRPETEEPSVLFMFLFLGVIINASLGVFNLLPIPPLDGARIIDYFWPPKYQHIYRNIERYSFFGLIGLILMLRMMDISITGSILGPIVDFFLTIFAGF